VVLKFVSNYSFYWMKLMMTLQRIKHGIFIVAMKHSILLQTVTDVVVEQYGSGINVVKLLSAFYTSSTIRLYTTIVYNKKASLKQGRP
jgi:hypothetical protein